LSLVVALSSGQGNVGVEFQVGVGITWGLVVVGEGSEARGVVGETPNLAARLETLAEPGTVLICPRARRLPGGHFDYRDVGLVALKGWAEPVPVWQVLGTSGVESRFEAMHKTKL